MPGISLVDSGNDDQPNPNVERVNMRGFESDSSLLRFSVPSTVLLLPVHVSNGGFSQPDRSRFLACASVSDFMCLGSMLTLGSESDAKWSHQHVLVAQ